jgi:transposase
LEKPELTPILEDLIIRSSLPMARIETCFAIDSTGMSSDRFTPWRAIKYRGVTEKNWAKLHAVVGVRSLIVTAAYVGDRDASDTVQLPRLMEITARNFTVREVYADKAYNTKSNQEFIASLGSKGFIPFKENHSGKGGGIWTEQYLRWQNEREEFKKHYHQRSKVEAAFMAMKSKFGNSLRSRTEIAMRNELLAKVICHNLARLNRAMEQFGIGTEFLAAILEAAE